MKRMRFLNEGKNISLILGSRLVFPIIRMQIFTCKNHSRLTGCLRKMVTMPNLMCGLPFLTVKPPLTRILAKEYITLPWEKHFKAPKVYKWGVRVPVWLRSWSQRCWNQDTTEHLAQWGEAFSRSLPLPLLVTSLALSQTNKILNKNKWGVVVVVCQIKESDSTGDEGEGTWHKSVEARSDVKMIRKMIRERWEPEKLRVDW